MRSTAMAGLWLDMRFYFPIAKVDGDQRMVWGYASTEALDDQGEIVRRTALQAALDDYMRFANIREMHQLSAVGKAQEAGIDDRGLYVGARIVDPTAWDKVREGVYSGFSIGGKVTGRDPSDRRVITALRLEEISLVDRPANPEAVFDCWKAQGEMMSAEPVQIWHCGNGDHRHLAKADALRCIETQGPPSAAASAIAAVEGALARTEAVIAKKAAASEDDGTYADPGYQSDGKKRYPIDSERHIRAAWWFIHRPRNAQRYTPMQLATIKERIIAAWKAKIDRAGPPAAQQQVAAQERAVSKALADVGYIARIILHLDWLKDRLAVEAAMEADGSPQPQRLQAILAELCDFLNTLVAEETGELLDGTDDPAALADQVALAAGAGGSTLIGDAVLHKFADRHGRSFAAALNKAQPAHRDGVLVDVAHHAIDRALGADGLLASDKQHLRQARDHLRRAGATPLLPEVEDDADDVRGMRGDPAALLDVAHKCLAHATEGAVCRDEKADAEAMRRHLKAAHDHLVAAGAKCDSERPADRGAGLDHAEKAALIKSLADIVPRIEQLARRVDEIAATPLPPLTMARGVTALSKQYDAGGDLLAPPEELAAALARMSPEEQTMTLIKAAHRNPIRVPA
jgi:phage head maturation protease